MRQIIIYILLGLSLSSVQAQVFEQMDSCSRENVVVADGFWQNCFVQMGLDMTLQNPYGYDFSKVFPNGKSFGLDVAVGKWFSHQVGGRLKFNWENKLPLLENDHANWLAPFDQPGVNREKGGYIAFYGDALFNLHNLFGAYRADRTWNATLYPRMGVNYNFGVSKGALLLGIGVLNTYRISDRWSVYGDIAYIMTGSGFVGSEKVEGTGTGSNSNGYLSFGIGAQFELGRKKVHDSRFMVNGSAENTESSFLNTDYTNSTNRGVLTNGIWDNWFVQAGMDMSLMNPYGCNFGKVIPNGMIFGLNGALGKWFTPEFAVRARVQWDNGLIPNNGVEWVAPADDPKENYKKGGLAVISVDGMMNLTNIIAGYHPDRKWHTIGYARAGIISQFVEGSASPVGGMGLEETYRLNDRWSLFGAFGYQVTTSEGMGVSTTGMEVAAGSNGFFDIDFGVRYDLGLNTWYKPGSRESGIQGYRGGRNWPRFIVNTIGSVGVAYLGKTAIGACRYGLRCSKVDRQGVPQGLYLDSDCWICRCYGHWH